MESNRACWGLLRRRQCLVPTWRGWLALALSCGLLLVVLARSVHPFLAVSAPVPARILVVEGWGDDAAFKATINEFNRLHYDKLFVTGGPLETGAPLSEYKTFAEQGAAILLKLGMNSNALQAVPAPWVRRDRTYASAVSLKEWLDAHQMRPASINLITAGPHARRSRLLFEKALGKGIAVGVIALPARGYDPRHWWRSSQGVRLVTGEAIAYGYARFLFRDANEREEPVGRRQ